MYGFTTPDDVITLLERWLATQEERGVRCDVINDCTHAVCRDTRKVLRDMADLADDMEKSREVLQRIKSYVVYLPDA